MLKDQVKHLPSSPGVYLFFKNDKPVYIGKATNLRARVLSHFSNARLYPKEAAMIDMSTRVEFQTTDSDFKAIVLETNLISKYKPKYNVRGRDDKSFLYIKITLKDPYPKIYPERKMDIDKKSLYFGPYANQKLVLDLIRSLRKIFPFCTQKRISRTPCFYSKIGLCAPCPNMIEKEENKKEKARLTRIYKTNIRSVIKLLEGKIDAVVNNLYKKIKEVTKLENYEEAMKIRNTIFKLNYLIGNRSFQTDWTGEAVDKETVLESLRQLLLPFFEKIKRLNRIEAIDISNYSLSRPVGSLVVFSKGLPDKAYYRRFRIKSAKAMSDFERIEEVLARRLVHKWPQPQLLVVDGGRPQVRIAKLVLENSKNKIPVIGIAKAPDRLIIGNENLPTIKPALNHPGFNLIRQIRDESHRFAKKYHLLLRNKDYDL